MRQTVLLRRLIIVCLIMLCGGVFFVPQAKAKTARISVVISRNIAPYLSALEGIRESLNTSGFNINFSRYDLLGDYKNGDLIIQEIERTEPDVIVVVGSEAARVISAQVTDLPLVLSMVLDTAIGETMISQSNITGASMNLSLARQLQELQAIAPRVRLVGTICSQDYYYKNIAKQEEFILEKTGIKLQVKFAKDESEFFEVATVLFPAVDAFLFVPDEAIVTQRSWNVISLESFRYNKPVLAPSVRFVEQGALCALGSDYKDVGKQTGELVLQILKGKSPQELQVTEARSPQLFLNLRTAKQMGIVVPQGVISRAEKVFE